MNATNHRTKPLVAAIAIALSMGFAAVTTAHDAGTGDSHPAAAVVDAQQGIASSDSPQAVRAQEAAGQDQPVQLDTVVVNAGIRGSQAKDIAAKRYATQILDSISAEDIGKLPDITITDSLQRVTGVQINRSGGEGSSLNVRGLPQVGTTLNGEVFMTASQIVSVQPDFTGVSSQLFSGVDVIKTPTAGLLNNGITGTVDLRTRRPWDLKSGWTFAGSADGARGSASDRWGREASGLASFNAGGKWGVLVSAAYSDLTHENSTDGMDQYDGVLFGENADSATAEDGFLGAFGAAPIPPDIQRLGGGNVDVNSNGTAGDAFFGSQDFTALDQQLQRKRLGINASVQGDLGSGFTLTGDVFFTRLKQYNRTSGYQLNSSAWQGATFVPVVSRATGRTVTGQFNDDAGWDQEFHTTQVYKKWLGDMETYSANEVTHTISRNFNLQLDYDNGGNFTGDVRWVSASAHALDMQSYVQFANEDGTDWPNNPEDAAPPGTYIYPDSLGGNRVFNPLGIAPNTIPVTVDMRGDHIGVSMPDGLQQLLSNSHSYALKALASEGNYDRRSSMNVFRADGHYNFDSSNVKLDFGLRNSIRSASNVNFNLVSPVYGGDGASDPAGCLVLYKAADVVMDGGGVDGACTAGNAQGYFRGGVLSAQNPSQLPALIRDNMGWYSNPAGVQGVRIYNLDPKAMDDPQAFHEALYPGEVRNIDPGNTWDVRLKETTAYLQADFDNSDAAIPFAGNLGVRVIRTSLYVTQHATGAPQPYGLWALDAGTIKTGRTYTDVLPAANVAFNFTPSLKLRLAYSKNMMPLNLDQWSGGLSLNYGIDTSTPGSTLFRVLGGSSAGNPGLDPWRSSNYDASLEYYGQSTMVSLAAFYVNVDSFIQDGSIQDCSLPDQDGVVRGHCVAISSPLQGTGSSLHGFEFDVKQNFKFLQGFWSNFGVDANFTYSPSNTGKDLAGNDVPFQDNSERQANLAVWYQDDRFQVRVAGNYRSKRAVSANFGGISGLQEYQAPTTYVDASVSYKLTPEISLYLQGSNLTNEHERYYLVWPDQVAHTTQFERRYVVGIRALF